LLERQNNCCAVCLKDASQFTINLAVDHDHATGEVRGLLCNYCNHRVVGRHRDPDLLQRVADYLRVGTGWFVPKKKKARRPRKVKTVGKNS
jgi:DNA-directed RNA polymerase subunit RPC12/RpoP